MNLRGKLLTVVAVLALLLAASTGGLFAAGDPDVKGNGKGVSNGVYIVQMLEDPVAAYKGGISGLKATKPNKGQKIDPNSPDVINYVSYLDNRHNDVLNGVGGGRKLYDFRYTFNGFAAELSDAQVASLKATAGVAAVTKDTLSHMDTSSTPAFLGLTAPGGLWDQLGGVGNAGEGVIVGVVDTGIWPENPSFSDRTGTNGNGTQDGKLDFHQIPGWHGKCTPGEEFPASNCNQKMIGAQWFNAGFGGDEAVKASFPFEYASARDADGHGSHTASTAAGNSGVTAIVDGINLGAISGMAPRARIAAYKVCWGRDQGGCFSSDSVAAIDQAVADGVDVINFSISGSTTSFRDPVEIAFLFAADAGVFVAASAGNSGPGASTVAHNSPWLTTVAAGTHDRLYQATVTLGNGATYTGVGLGAAVPSSSLILSTVAGLPGANPTQVQLCFSGTLDPAVVTGKIVVCDRGTNARVDKSLAVQMAGGVGMILTNTNVNSLNADLHFVPTVHLQVTDRAAVRVYAATAGATASLSQGQQVAGAVAPDVAAFSSRGPALAGDGDLLKPDIMAPGVDVLAAVSPAAGGRNWDFLSGTSMSSPHMAGLGALLKQAHPDWTPAMIKSAFMTTASQTRNNGSAIPGNSFGYGAGQVVPNSAVNPGLVYNAGFLDYLGFMCGTGQLPSATCAAFGATVIDPSNLNYPSIAVGALAGAQTVTRTVTNVSNQKETYTASFTGLTGITVVLPASFTVNPGQSFTYNVSFTRTTAPLNSYTFGALVLTGNKGHVVKSQIALRPVALSAPVSISGNGGPLSYNVTFGYTGAFTATARGLIPATSFTGNVVDDPANDINTALGSGVGITLHSVAIPAGATYARFSLFDDFTDGADDIDLYVFNSGGALVGSSGGGTSAEEVNLLNPAAGNYTVVVHGWQTDGPDANYTLFTWALGSAAAGNMTVSAPASATLGSTGAINLAFSGLAPATKYLGSVAYSGSTGMPNPTIVRVDTP
ncbi:MAG: S8 family serine peptidase [Chloroflexi bacterium]|nr:S8 family serine peptidase [Chloroflexota bacterium]